MTTYYQITLRGHLDTHWSAWFDNMTISNEANGEAVLAGPLAGWIGPEATLLGAVALSLVANTGVLLVRAVREVRWVGDAAPTVPA